MNMKAPIKAAPASSQSGAYINHQKSRKGWTRLWYATAHSLAGLRAGWAEPAFRLEALIGVVLVPLSFWLGRTWLEVAVLAGSIVFLMVAELLNTAVESTVDRVSLEWHALSKRAKDMGSAAVLLATILAAGVWVGALWQRFLPL
jgi:diacylglycerol kinase (ATP)